MCFAFLHIREWKLCMILSCTSIANHFTPFIGKKSIVFKAFITNEFKVVISGIFYLLIIMMMIYERKEIKVWNMKYGYCAMNKGSYEWTRDPMK